MVMMKAFLLCFVILFTTAFAGKPECEDSDYPESCVCPDGGVYDAKYNWCTSNLIELSGECPEDGPGQYPNCNCGTGKKYDKDINECKDIDRTECPSGATGKAPSCKCPETFAFDEVHWMCRPWYIPSTRPTPQTRTYKPVVVVPHCRAYTRGTYPDCHPIPCPSHALNPEDFEPYCRFNVTYVEYKPCPAGKVGTPPNCYKPCPAYHTGRYPDCVRIKCQTGPGWSGEFAPDCKFTPSCPPEFPGVWPNCDIYKAHSEEKGEAIESNTYLSPTQAPTYLPPTTSTTTTTTPRPTCAPGYLGAPPNCYKPTTTTTTTTTTERPYCPSGYAGIYPNCYIPTTTTTTTTQRPYCPSGYAGIYPNCYKPTTTPVPYCPSGYAGTFPNCYKPTTPAPTYLPPTTHRSTPAPEYLPPDNEPISIRKTKPIFFRNIF